MAARRWGRVLCSLAGVWVLVHLNVSCEAMATVLVGPLHVAPRVYGHADSVIVAAVVGSPALVGTVVASMGSRERGGGVRWVASGLRSGLGGWEPGGFRCRVFGGVLGGVVRWPWSWEVGGTGSWKGSWFGGRILGGVFRGVLCGRRGSWYASVRIIWSSTPVAAPVRVCAVTDVRAAVLVRVADATIALVATVGPIVTRMDGGCLRRVRGRGRSRRGRGVSCRLRRGQIGGEFGGLGCGSVGRLGGGEIGRVMSGGFSGLWGWEVCWVLGRVHSWLLCHLHALVPIVRRRTAVRAVVVIVAVASPAGTVTVADATTGEVVASVGAIVTWVRSGSLGGLKGRRGGGISRGFVSGAIGGFVSGVLGGLVGRVFGRVLGWLICWFLGWGGGGFGSGVVSGERSRVSSWHDRPLALVREFGHRCVV